MPYIPGDYWCICQRTGGKYRRSEMRKEWTGFWVHKSVFNIRNAQDFVRSVPDNPAVHPALPDVEQTMSETTLNGALTKHATSVTLTSATGMEKYDGIGIVLDDGLVYWNFITADESSDVVTLNDGIPSAAASGNVVYQPSLNSETWE